MVKVTDKNYFIDKALLGKMDLGLERHKHNNDNLWIISGSEGTGKSTIARVLAYYLGYKIGKKFTVDNIFFDTEKMLKFAATNESEVIVFDEAATGAMAMHWQNRMQQKLIQTLMMARKKKHFYFFVIPRFDKLNEYIVNRAIGLIHTYSPDLIKQGFFVYFKKDQKDFLYERMKGHVMKSYKRGWSIRGTFIKGNNLVDMEAYEKKKDEAIMALFKDEDKPRVDRNKERLLLILQKLKGQGNSSKEIAKLTGMAVRTVTTWLKEAETASQQHKVM